MLVYINLEEKKTLKVLRVLRNTECCVHSVFQLLPYKYSIRFENEDSVIHSVPAVDLR